MLVCRVCRLDCAAGAAPDAAAALARVGRDEAPLIDRKGEKPIWDEYQIYHCWWPGECVRESHSLASRLERKWINKNEGTQVEGNGEWRE